MSTIKAISEQRNMENKYSRSNIRAAVLKDIKDSELSPIITASIEAIRKYTHGDYYESKNKRIRYLRDTMQVTEIVTEIMIIILSVQGTQPIQAAASKLAHKLKFKDMWDGIRTASEILAVVCEADMFDIILAKNSETGSLMIESNFSLSDDTLLYLENTKYLPPMVCEPQPIVDNMSSGYLTKNESVILGAGNHHDDYQALDTLNIAQAVPLALNEYVFEMEETSKKPLDTDEKMRNFFRMVTSSRLVYHEMKRLGNRFFLTWKYDKRGRMYSQGYQINIQSTSFKKAIISLADKQVITGA